VLFVGVVLALTTDPGCDCHDDDDDSTIPDDDDSVASDDDDDDDSSPGDDDAVTLGDAAVAHFAPGFLPACEGGVMAAFTSGAIDPPLQDSEGYLPPAETLLDAVRSAMEAALAGEGEATLASLTGTGYQVCLGAGEEEGLVLWHPEEAGLGQPLVVWRHRTPRPLVLGVPHPNFELGTLPESVDLFEQLDARALIVSGTHRCANTESSPCEGETTVCGDGSEPFRESDMSHVVESLFQVSHEVLTEAFPDDWIVSVHGMDGDGISVSDGTTQETHSAAPVAILGAALMDAFPAEEVTSCNDWPGAEVDERFCGEYDVQGRMVNGSNWPCLVAPSSTTDRFVHLEQSIWVRAQSELVVAAFEVALSP
jgi:hypothetical protein